MRLALNAEQAKGLASFYFDIAKGLFLGGIGFATFSQPEVKLATFVTNITLSYFCVRLALAILKDV